MVSELESLCNEELKEDERAAFREAVSYLAQKFDVHNPLTLPTLEFFGNFDFDEERNSPNPVFDPNKNSIRVHLISDDFAIGYSAGTSLHSIANPALFSSKKPLHRLRRISESDAETLKEFVAVYAACVYVAYSTNEKVVADLIYYKIQKNRADSQLEFESKKALGRDPRIEMYDAAMKRDLKSVKTNLGNALSSLVSDFGMKAYLDGYSNLRDLSRTNDAATVNDYILKNVGDFFKLAETIKKP